MIAFHCVFDEEGSKLTNHAGVSRLRVDGVPLQVNAKHLTTAFDYLESQFSEQFLRPDLRNARQRAREVGQNERRRDADAASRGRLHPH